MTEVFPFTIEPDPVTGWSPYDFRQGFMRAKPKEMTWFAYAVVVRSRTEVTFIVHGMHDNFFGGVGEEVSRFDASVSSEVTSRVVENRIKYLATLRRAKELNDEEDRIIESYAEELRKATP